jgi:hypothetical protein
MIILYGSIFDWLRIKVQQSKEKRLKQLFDCSLCFVTQCSIWITLPVMIVFMFYYHWFTFFHFDIMIAKNMWLPLIVISFGFIIFWIFYSFIISGIAYTMIELAYIRNMKFEAIKDVLLSKNTSIIVNNNSKPRIDKVDDIPVIFLNMIVKNCKDIKTEIGCGFSRRDKRILIVNTFLDELSKDYDFDRDKLFIELSAYIKSQY